ncbi:histidine kinase [Cellulomonas cellasea]|uniref:sensor histidine kinase n=1 Tax=Cellulomonas cellasea TaxID=43670 RepID=UPI0025A49CA3|nr:histidine kinase [Cellulomonas cellasea]MDM8083758.1 histidine kinase [Cellulomonas cellasea]
MDLRRLRDLWQRQSVTLRDLPLALVLALGPLIPSWQSQGTRLGDMPDRPLDALAAVAVALQCLPLAVRRRWPAVCLALVSAGFALDQLRGYHTVAGSALAVALVSAGAHLDRYRRTTATLATAAYVAMAVGLHRDGSVDRVSDYVTFYVLLALAWGVGAWLRQSRIAEAEHRRQVADSTRTAERTRIARELHDVVTHHVTAMVVQAEAARYVTADPERLDRTLTAVTDTGRSAISDLRRLLDVLNPDHGADPRTPTVGELHGLVELTRQAGQPVEYVEEGSPPETTGVAEVAAYRVVQEALTNALKHAHGSRTIVRVRHGEKEITVEVSTDGSGPRARIVGGSVGGIVGGSGRGLAGLRERVAILGGEFSADAQTGGGFVVQARIPAGSPS